jgi:hypothetical protein
LEFLEGAKPAEGETDRVAGAGALGERGVEDAAATEVADQALGDLERAAVRPDVLPSTMDLGPLREDLPQRGVEGLGLIERSRGGILRFPWRGNGLRREHIGDQGGGGRRGPCDSEGLLDARLDVGLKCRLHGLQRADETLPNEGVAESG